MNLVKLNLLKRKCQIRIERKAESRPHLNSAIEKTLMAKTGDVKDLGSRDSDQVHRA